VSDDLTKHSGGHLHRGPEHSAPYPTSRGAPPIELLDLARAVASAETFVTTRASAKLRVIADQIRSLQAEARKVLEEARRDQELHRAACSFRRTPGQTYHLYRRGDGQLQFALLSPGDWGGRPPSAYLGAYRLENDMSWTPAEAIEERDDTEALIGRLLEERGDP
jgi:hypothetical protein